MIRLMTAAFARFAVARRPRTARLQAETRQLPAIYHAGGLKRLARNLSLRAMPAEMFLKRLRWIYNWDVMQ